MQRCGGAETGSCDGSERKKRGLGGAERERACEPLSLSLLPLLIGSRGGAEEARRGEAWGSIVPTPHVPRLSSLNGETKLPREGERPLWATEDPRPDQGSRVAGPGLRRRPVTRVRSPDLAATWPREGPWSARRSPPPPAYKTRGSLKSAYARKAGSSGWEADQASRPPARLGARSASGTTVGVSSHG